MAPSSHRLLVVLYRLRLSKIVVGEWAEKMGEKKGSEKSVDLLAASGEERRVAMAQEMM